jgi:hypothetical protein
MIGNRMRAFALSTAFTIIRSARPCGPVRRKLEHGRRDYPWPLRKNPDWPWNKPRPNLFHGWIVFHPIQLGGRVSASGHVRMNVVAGSRIAHGTGRFSRFRGSGTWAGSGPSGLCSGVWSAIRS